MLPMPEFSAPLRGPWVLQNPLDLSPERPVSPLSIPPFNALKSAKLELKSAGARDEAAGVRATLEHLGLLMAGARRAPARGSPSQPREASPCRVPPGKAAGQGRRVSAGDEWLLRRPGMWIMGYPSASRTSRSLRPLGLLSFLRSGARSPVEQDDGESGLGRQKLRCRSI